MNVVKLFVSLMILFVAVNFIIAIYRFANRRWREGLENATTCPSGCTAPKELSGNCGSLQKDADGSFFKSCPYECTDPGAGCQYDTDCSPCGSSKITGDWDKNGNYIGTNESVQKSSANGVADNAQAATATDGTMDKDTAAAYNQATGAATSNTDPSSPAATTTTCDVLAIHNKSAHTSTYGQWFPAKTDKLNLSQTNYEHAGRKFLNEESIKKGIRTPLIMDSEAEVLGRLLWRVHLAAITQNCMENTPGSVKTTMHDELALMKKVHEIQNASATSSLKGCDINRTCHPKQTAKCPTTGMMTATPSGSSSKDNRPSATTSINSTIPTMFAGGTYTGYSTDYKPRNPNLKPKPYNSIWDIF